MAEAKPDAPSVDAPLHTLTRDQLSVLLYFWFTDEELTQVMSAQRVSIPGYRADKLSGVQKADAIADEIRAYPKAREAVIEKLKEIYEYPALDGVALPPQVASEVSWLATQEDAAMRLLWRVLSDGDEKVRKEALPALDELSKRFYGPADKGAAPPQPARAPKQKIDPADTAALAAIEKESKEARLAAEQANKKAAELKDQLKETRANEAKLTKAEAKARKQAETATQELKKAKDALAEARKKGGKNDLEKAKKELASAQTRVAALEEQKAALTAELDAAKVQQARAAKTEAPKEETAADEPEEAPREWLLPRFTPEFYDSLEGWDLRIQRAAYKQAHLLSENHRHPSLQALPLQGAPGYYRVRVATDVRLIYRRIDERHVEILSLIDREDLDRYVRQAKTR